MNKYILNKTRDDVILFDIIENLIIKNPDLSYPIQ